MQPSASGRARALSAFSFILNLTRQSRPAAVRLFTMGDVLYFTPTDSWSASVREKYELESTYQHSRLSTNDTTTTARLADQSERATVRPITTQLIMRAASLCAPPHYLCAPSHYARRLIMRAGPLLFLTASGAPPHYARRLIMRAGSLCTPVHDSS